MIRRCFKIFILVFICLLGLSCSLQDKYGTVTFALPGNGNSSGRSAANGEGELPLGPDLPDIYTIKLTPNVGKIIEIEGKAGQNVVIDNLVPGNYEVAVKGQKSKFILSGKTTVNVKAGKTAEARLELCMGTVGVTLAEATEILKTFSKGSLKIKIADNYTEENFQLFKDQIKLRNETLPIELDLTECKGLKFIRDKSFIGVSCLTKVVLPQTVTELGNQAFETCVNLRDINLENIETIGVNAFQQTKLTNVNLTSLKTISNNCFKDCSFLISIKMGSSLQKIGGKAFENCIGITTIMIPPSVTTIDFAAFQGCSNLSFVTMTGAWTLMDFFSAENNGEYAASQNPEQNATVLKEKSDKKWNRKKDEESTITPYTYYVKAGGTGDGSKANPYGSVYEVLNHINNIPEQEITGIDLFTIKIIGEVKDDNQITIEGDYKLLIEGDGVGATLSGNSTHRVMYVGGINISPNVTLRNIKITGGKSIESGAGILLYSGLLKLEDGVVITGNTLDKTDHPNILGSGIYVSSNAPVAQLAMSGSANVESDNDIYLWGNASVEILGDLTSPAVANVSAGSAGSGSAILTGTPKLIAANFNKFNFVSSSDSQKFILDSDGKLSYTVTGFSNDKFEQKLSKTEITRVYVATEQDMNDFYSDIGGLESGVILDIKFAFNVNEVNNLANVPEIKSIYVDCPYIASSAFSGCTNLADVTLSNNVINIQQSAFDGCALTTVKFEDLATEWNIGSSKFTPSASGTDNGTFLKSHTTELWSKIVKP